MSHPEQMHFFQELLDTFPTEFAGKVLDVGCLDINGGPHTLLNSEEYVGVDIAEGPNVTLISRGEDLTLPSEYFDVAMSSECFGHNR